MNVPIFRKTIKGAAFCGVELIRYRSLDGTEHVVIEAVTPGFERAQHLYPLAQTIEFSYADSMPPLMQAVDVKGRGEGRPFGDRGVSVHDEISGHSMLTAEEFRAKHGKSF